MSSMLFEYIRLSKRVSLELLNVIKYFLHLVLVHLIQLFLGRGQRLQGEQHGDQLFFRNDGVQG